MTNEESNDLRAPLRSPPTLVAPCLLLLLAECPGHGYELTERLKNFGLEHSSTGRLYRDLRRLEDAGLVHSYWEPTQVRGPARRVYELTAAGTETLLGCAEDADELARTLRRYVRRARAASRRLSASQGGGQRRPE